MSPAQPQYLIRANSRCRTHRPGTEICYIGPRRSVPAGWIVVRRIV